MKLDQNPVFRRIIVPWYDSDKVCLAFLGFLAAVVLFGVTGLSVTREDPVYADFAWVPGLLLALSATIFLTTSIRLILRRTAQRHSR